mmetsp:Transcript_8794/g.21473  ORF Transcript_8794/g.21473 Transcript_8794/m.21473 type:complete len:406 (+) Transcript_8794:98-1315(+)
MTSSTEPSSRKRVVDRTSVGEPAKKPRNDTETIHTETIHYAVRDFKKKSLEGGCFTFADANAHGYKWTMCVKPYQKLFTRDPAGFCYLLVLPGNIPITASVVIRCTNNYDGQIHSEEPSVADELSNLAFCSTSFLKTEDIIDNYTTEDGSFEFDCEIRIAQEDRHKWYPEAYEPEKYLLDLYQDASSETSDAVFAVDDATYRAHKKILSLRCKKLYEIAEESCNDTIAPIPISNVRGEIFGSLLDCIYTFKQPKINDEKVAIELLVAADFFECVYVKLYAESVLVHKFLKTENAAELLILGDSHSCALLKEAASNLILADMDSVKKTKDWPKVEESSKLLKELLYTLYSKEQLTFGYLTPTGIVEELDVTFLRNGLQEAKLEVDGSHEVIKKRLMEHWRCNLDKN